MLTAGCSIGSVRGLCAAIVGDHPNFSYTILAPNGADDLRGVSTVAKGKRTFQPNNRRRARVDLLHRAVPHLRVPDTNADLPVHADLQ